MNTIKLLGISACLLVLAACASTVNSGLDKARFALDDCSVTNTDPCDAAIDAVNHISVTDPAYPAAAMIKSSALASKAGIEILTLMSDLTKSGTNSDAQRFKMLHDTAVLTVRDTDSLRASIIALTIATPPPATADNFKDFYFQMGILQSVESFTLPSVKAQPTATSLVTVTNITAADKGNAQDDFIAADINLRISGISDPTSKGWDAVKAGRQNYCILKTITLAPQGFLLSELQDVITCQLCKGVTDTTICAKDSDTMTAADFKSPQITSCTNFNYTACANAVQPAL